MRSLNHGNICRIFEVFEGHTNFYLILDLMEGQTL